MVKRGYWIDRIEKAWERRPVVWLTGVRRVGKTLLSQGLEDIEYFDCELPRTRKPMEDPEAFLSKLEGKRVVLDEVHRLSNPSELLKIAADHFSKTRILATGSSTLEASRKFKDTLTGRKETVWLTPMNEADLHDFGNPDLVHRLQHGGLPPLFLNPALPERECQEWMDSYWAKDIQELFRLERRSSFQKFLELLFVNSGGIFEATSYAAPCEISRTTVTNYLEVLQATHVVHVVRPFSKHRSSEIVSAPKVYAFDTGFVCCYRRWNALRPEDLGILWEHYVLNEIQSRLTRIAVGYWRDKRGHEVDFVLMPRGGAPVLVECKWSFLAKADPASIRAFRQRYPLGENWIVAHDVDRPHFEREKGFKREWMGLKELVRRLTSF